MSIFDGNSYAFRSQLGGYAPYGAGVPAPYPAVPKAAPGYITGQGAPAGTAVPFAGMPPSVPAGTPMTSAGTPVPGALPPGRAGEVSYIENILRLNLGKTGTFYMTYENNTEWNAKIFKGKLEAAGRDHIIISDPETGKRFLLLMVNLDYITFDEQLNYFYPPGVPLPR